MADTDKEEDGQIEQQHKELPCDDDNGDEMNDGDNEDAWKDADFLSFSNNYGDDNDEEYGEGNRNDKNGSKNNNSAMTMKGTSAFLSTGNDLLREKELPPWILLSKAAQTPSKSLPPLVVLHNEIVDFVSIMEPRADEMAQRQALVREVTNVAVGTFGGPSKCKVVVFGSQATGLFLPTSDIDLVVQCDLEDDEDDHGEENKNYEENESKKDHAKAMENWDLPTSSQALRRLGDALHDKFKEELSYLEIVENTRIPIVKFTHEPTGLSVDVCFNQEGGPEAAELMKELLDEIPALRPLCFVLKCFTSIRGINEPYTGGVGSFMLQMMVVSYLQQRAREEYNSNKAEIAAISQNLGSMLLEFFELYGIDFNYVTTAVSVRHGGYYFPKGGRGKKDIFWKPSRPLNMALENPLDPTLDVGVATFRMGLIQKSFETAFRILLAHTSDPVLPAPSILAKIIPPNNSMRKRAEMRQALMDKGKSERDAIDLLNDDSDDGGSGGGRFSRVANKADAIELDLEDNHDGGKIAGQRFNKRRRVSQNVDGRRYDAGSGCGSDMEMGSSSSSNDDSRFNRRRRRHQIDNHPLRRNSGIQRRNSGGRGSRRR